MAKRCACRVRRTKGRWCVYLLRCADGSLYCGITNELKARIVTHNKGRGAKYTRSRLPVKLAYVETVKTRSAAQRREYQIKKLSKKSKEELCRHRCRVGAGGRSTTVSPRTRRWVELADDQ
jgi:putative endonuclease